MDQEIYHDPEFNWWVNYVFKKRLRIISLVKKRKSCYFKKTYKFGNELPKSVAQLYELYKKMVNTLRTDAIFKKMKDVSPAFKKLDN